MEPHSHQAVRWEKRTSARIASCRIFDVYSTKFHHPVRNTERDFFTIEYTDWANILAITPDHQMVLVRQFRFGSDDFSLEIPGGVIERGEDPLAGGLRELREETGYVGQNATVIGRPHPNPAVQNNLCHLILVENATLVHELEWDTDEEIEVMLKPIAEVYELAHGGKITHALALDALFFFYPYWERLKARGV